MSVRWAIPGGSMRLTSKFAAVDKQGKTVESYLSRTRDITASKAFFRKAFRRHGAHG